MSAIAIGRAVPAPEHLTPEAPEPLDVGTLDVLTEAADVGEEMAHDVAVLLEAANEDLEDGEPAPLYPVRVLGPEDFEAVQREHDAAAAFKRLHTGGK